MRFLTGHTKDGRVALEWEVLVKEQLTLVFYMGLIGLPMISSQLIKHGMDAQTPVAVIQQGTTQTQRVLVGTLASISQDVIDKEIQAPTIIIVGKVVNLQKSLSWYGKGEKLPK